MTPPHHFLFAVMVAGGIQTAFYNLKQAIAKRPGVRSTWLKAPTTRQESAVSPDRWAAGSSRGMSLTGWWRLQKSFRPQEGVDAAFIMDRFTTGALWCLWRAVPFILATDMTPALHSRSRQPGLSGTTPRATLRERVQRWAARRVYHGAFHILPWSGVVKESLVRDYHVPEDRLTLQPPGINLFRWPAPPRENAEEPGRPFRVLHVGTNFREKGGEEVLEIAADPEFAGAEFHCVTPETVGIVPANTVVHRNLKPNSEGIMDLYRMCDVLLLPTRVTTFSIVTLEAMASCLPVIITDIGSHHELVTDGATGFLVPPGDRAGLRERLRLLRRDPHMRVRMGREARARVEAGFSLQRQVETVMQLLAAAARSRSGAQDVR